MVTNSHPLRAVPGYLEIYSARWKGADPQRELDLPKNWFAPPGGNRSVDGGNEIGEAFGRVSRRFVKKEQMEWTLRGAHLLPQTGTKVLNDELEEVFSRWYPQLRPKAACPPACCRTPYWEGARYFRWRDSRHNNREHVMTLDAQEDRGKGASVYSCSGGVQPCNARSAPLSVKCESSTK